MVGLTELYYAGSHGMDIMGPVEHTVSDDHPNSIKSTDQQVRDNKAFKRLPFSLTSRNLEKYYTSWDFIHFYAMLSFAVLLLLCFGVAGQGSKSFPAC